MKRHFPPWHVDTTQPKAPWVRMATTVMPAILLAACGGGGGMSASGTGPGGPSSPVTLSAVNPLPATCGLAVGSAQDVFVAGSAVQPQLAVGAIPGGLNTATGVSPLAVSVWEQDRWNAIGARAIVLSTSTNGGLSWSSPQALPFTVCGNTASPYDRASDPSVSVAPAAGNTGSIVYASALAFSAANFMAAGGSSSVLVSRSLDGGITWSSPTALIADTGTNTGPNYFNDRDAIAADPNGPDVYVVWDRISSAFQFGGGGTVSVPTYLSHSTDYGASWPAIPAVIYDPGPNLQTFNNQVVVLPDGSVGIAFTLYDGFNNTLQFIRSTNHGLTWPASGTATTVAVMTPTTVTNPINNGAPVRDSPAMAQLAVDPVTGTLAAVWEEASFSNGLRNGIALSLSTDLGAHWSTPKQVNTVNTVQAFDPGVHFGAHGQIAITYDDFRNFVTGSSVLSTSAWLRVSNDGGNTWQETLIAGPFDLNRAPPTDQIAGSTGNALFLGDQQGLGWNGQAWLPVLTTTNSRTAQITATTLP